VNLNNGPLDELAALGSSAANQHWVLGDSGMNFNADTSSSADLVSSTIDRYQLSAGAGNNTISAQGGFGTGAPYDRAGTFLELDGESGNDTLEGSENGDLIKGGDGNDTVRGFGGDDGLYPGFGDDVVDGGAGVGDVLGYATCSPPACTSTSARPGRRTPKPAATALRALRTSTARSRPTP
jgi:Ca2+-binding RTX toxin-like protein